MTECPDYSQYSLTQLRDAALAIDRQHADHLELLQHWIREREKQAAESRGHWFAHMLWGLALGRVVFTIYAGVIILVTDTAAQGQVAVQWQLYGLVIPIGFGVYGFRRAARRPIGWLKNPFRVGLLWAVSAGLAYLDLFLLAWTAMAGHS